MKCGWMQDRLLLYLAGELGARQAAGLVRHLETCASCATLAEELAETGGKVNAVLRTDVEAPAALDAHVMEVIRGLPARRRSWGALFPQWRWHQGLALNAAALSLLVAGFSAGSWHATRRVPISRVTAPSLDLGLLGDAHRRSQMKTASAELRISAPERLSQELTPLVQFPVAAVDLRPEGLRLVGGSRTTVQGHPAACLHYEWKGERVSFFQMDATKLSPPALRPVRFNGEFYLVGERDHLSYVAWRSGRTSCALVARARPEHLLRLACYACDALDRL
jgi:anti-sigma factor RsiW